MATYKWWAQLKSQFNYDITITTGNLVNSVNGPSRVNNLETFTYTVVFDHNDDCQFKTVTATNCTCTYEGHIITISNVTGPVTLDVVGQYIPCNISLIYSGAGLYRQIYEANFMYTDINGVERDASWIDWDLEQKYPRIDIVVAKGTSVRCGADIYFYFGSSSRARAVYYNFQYPISPSETDTETWVLHLLPGQGDNNRHDFIQTLDKAFDGASFIASTYWVYE